MAASLLSPSWLLCSGGSVGQDYRNRSGGVARLFPTIYRFDSVVCSSSKGVVSRLSLRRRSCEFAGLKMSATEGLTRRAKEPQIAVDETKVAAKKSQNYVSAQLAKPGVKSLVIAVALPLVFGSIDAFFNSPASQWFKDLKKPWWQPPGPIFGGAWSILYPLMGLASWLVWAQGGFHQQSGPLILYLTQLFLNLLWPLFFFGWKNLGLALVDILALVGVLAATINSFKSVNHVASNLLKPYLAWVLFATALNFNLWLTNRGTASHEVARTQ